MKYYQKENKANNFNCIKKVLRLTKVRKSKVIITGTFKQKICDNKGNKYAPNNMGSEADCIFQSWLQKYLPSHTLFCSMPWHSLSRGKSELALVTGLKPVRFNRSDSMRLLRVKVRRNLAAFTLVSWNACSPKSHPWGAPSQNPNEGHAVGRPHSWRSPV